MDNSQAVSIIIGLAIPFVISLIKDTDWDRKGKFLIALFVSVIAGFATSWAAGNLVFVWSRALIDAAIVFSAGQVVFKMILEDSGIDKKLTGQ